MFSLGTITIQVPALDRLLDYLQGIQQGNVDAATVQIVALNARLKQSNDRLAVAVQNERGR